MENNTKAFKPFSVTLMTGALLLGAACTDPKPSESTGFEQDVPTSADTQTSPADVYEENDTATVPPFDSVVTQDVEKASDIIGADPPISYGLPLGENLLAALREQGEAVWLPLHEYHGGTDYMVDWNAYWTATPPLVPALATQDGTLVHVGDYFGLGKTVILKTNESDGIAYFLYGHLDTYGVDILEGATVYKGQTLGTVGTSGYAGPCPHIHLQIVEEPYWDKTLGEVGLENCGLVNPFGIESFNALVQASCFHYFSEGNTLKPAMDTVYRPAPSLITYPESWSEVTPFYPYVECANVCAAYCFEMDSAPEGCAFPVGNEECPQCVKVNEDTRCDGCPGSGCGLL